MTQRDKAVLWVHETVGDNLDGEATLQECLDWIAIHGSDSEKSTAAVLAITVFD